MTTITLLTVFFFFFFFFFLFSFVSSSNAISSTAYVIIMDERKMGDLAATLEYSSRSWPEALLESIRISSSDDEQHPQPKLIQTYNKVVFGFAATLTDQQLQTLKNVDGFVVAIKDRLYTLHTTHSPEFLGLELGKGMWSGDLGSDVIIGVIDTGVWPEHPSFNDDNLSAVPSHWKGKCQNYTGFNASSCNKKLIGAAVFYKGYKEIMNDTSEYKTPRDSDGHGTHTASTAGGTFVSDANILGMANGTAAGMSPGVRIATYKVCFQTYCSGSDILAAMDQAVHDGVDVLSISMGGPPLPYYMDPIAIGAFGAVRKGVIVSLSAGNSGPYTSSVSNVAPWMMTVAASSTDRDFLAHVHLGGGKELSGTSLSSADHSIKNNIALVYLSNASSLCLSGSLSRSQVKGKVVVCDRGNNSRVAKGEVVKRAGGVAMILANTPENGEDRIADPHVLPAVALGASAADAVREYASSYKNATVSIQFKGTVYHNRAPAMAAFSSRGPSALDPNILKPDITAPGLNILAAFPPNISPTSLDSDSRRVLFNIMSGTSMSAPHVSGILALVKSVHRDWSPAAIKSALMTTAYVLDSDNSSISDMSDGKSPATPFAFGSGHVDPNKATDPGLIYNISTHDYLNYLCSLKYDSTVLMQMFSHHKTCHPLSGLRPGDLNYPSFSVDFRNESKIIYKRTVTNVAASSDVITYRANVSKPQGVSIKVKPNVLKFTTKGEKLSYNITFKAKRNMQPKTSNFSFGYIKWVSGGEDHIYSVRSPIAVIWN